MTALTGKDCTWKVERFTLACARFFNFNVFQIQVTSARAAPLLSKSKTPKKCATVSQLDFLFLWDYCQHIKASDNVIEKPFCNKYN